MDPDIIIHGEEGFDMKYSNSGMWGKGLYFAKNSKYSDPYGYTTHLKGKSVRNMILALVNLGEPEIVPETNPKRK
jgi:hypothetical protein